MFRNLFSPDSQLMIFMSQLTDCIFLSMFWVLGCFPVVSIGPATAALYDACVQGFRKNDKHSWTRFLQSFRKNFKAGILPGLLVVATGAGMGWLLIRVWNAAVAGSVSWMVFSASALVGLLMLGTLSLMMPMVSRFENSFAALVKNSVVLALGNAPRAVLLGLIDLGAIYLCVRFFFCLFFIPALAAVVGSLLIEPIFRPFMEEK